ncbi:hypothetical protein GCM10011318_28350 [Phaeocystidibacter marisrubri]|nr:hypothetical protein GCM10011318_28350 [Phaeocystidibacter marisrubri]
MGQTWNGSTSSDWNNSANWNGGVPGSNSTATIPGNTTHSPSITSNVTVKNLVIGDWNNPTTLSVDGGSLTVKEDVSLYNFGELKMTSGSILLDRTKNASFSFAYTDAKITLLGGTFTSDLDIQVNGSFDAGNANVIMNGNLTIGSNKSGSAIGGTWTINNNLNVLGSLDLASTNLNVQGTLAIGSGGILYAGTGNHNLYGIFDVGNNGTYYGEDAYTIVYTAITAKNSAYISVDNGTIEFRNDVDLFQTATLEVVGSGTVSIVGSGKFKQDGHLLIGDGNLAVSGDVTFQQGGTLDIEAGNVSISGNATFSHSGTMNVATGTVTIDGNAEFDQTGTVNTDSATINIYGNLTLGSNGSTFNAGESTINLNGGTFTNNGTFNPDSSTVNFTGDAGQTINGDITFYNLNVETNGELTANGDVIVLNSTAVDSSSTVSVEDGHDLDLQGELTDPSGNIDITRPYVRHITSVTTTSVKLEFNEPVTLASGNTTSNYAVNRGLTVTSATVQSDAKFVVLTLSGAMNLSQEYSFTLNNIIGAVHGATISTDHIKRYIYKPATNPPGTGISNLRLTVSNTTSAKLNWDMNGASGVLIILSAKSAVSVSPVDFQEYTSSAIFGSGSEMGNQQFAVFSGSDSSVTISGLTPNKEYHAAVFTYNGNFPSGASYNTLQVSRIRFSTSFEVNAKLFLSGAMNDSGDEMNNQLVQAGVLPMSQPFQSIYNYDGTESISSYPNTDIVDWVMLELRKAPSPGEALDSTVVARRALFLLKDGRIVDIDGSSLPVFNLNHPGSFVAVVYHRNHLPSMSGDTLTIDGSNHYSLDFTASSDAWYETNSAVILETGAFAVSSGKTVQGNDYEVDEQAYMNSWNNKNQAGYLSNDVDLDGYVDSSDRAKIFNSRNAKITMPAQSNGK